MTRTLTILNLFLAFYLTSCGQTTTQNKSKEQLTNSLAIDTSLISILPFDTTQIWVFKNSKPSTLTTEDFQTIETLLNKCIAEYNIEQEKQYKKVNEEHPDYKLDKKNFVIDLKKYKRQYITTTNTKGEKEVWINCFCRQWDRNWRKELIVVRDGGNCYFNLKINLTTKQYYELRVNGDA